MKKKPTNPFNQHQAGEHKPPLRSGLRMILRSRVVIEPGVCMPFPFVLHRLVVLIIARSMVGLNKSQKRMLRLPAECMPPPKRWFWPKVMWKNFNASGTTHWWARWGLFTFNAPTWTSLHCTPMWHHYAFGWDDSTGERMWRGSGAVWHAWQWDVHGGVHLWQRLSFGCCCGEERSIPEVPGVCKSSLSQGISLLTLTHSHSGNTNALNLRPLGCHNCSRKTVKCLNNCSSGWASPLSHRTNQTNPIF